MHGSVESTDLPSAASQDRSQLQLPVTSARSVMHAMYDAAVLMTPDLRVLDYNAAYTSLCGIRPRQLKQRLQLGASAFELLSESSGADREAAAACFREKRGVHLAEREVHDQGGRKTLAWLSFLPVLDDLHDVVAIMEIVRDVSGDAQAQAKLKELLASTKARAEDLERAVELRTLELTAALEQVTRLSRTDALTGLLNRRAMTELAEKAVALANRHHRCLAVLMCDLDHFKRVNDEHGHQGGDRILQAVADALAANVRDTDAVSRFGGEEFVVLLTETSPDAIMTVAQRLNESIRAIRVPEIIPECPRRQTISIGVAVLPDHAMTFDGLLAAADSALYSAKQSGRDRAVFHD
jgi:diguanylate cyclase (GGDEF)-like protein